MPKDIKSPLEGVTHEDLVDAVKQVSDSKKESLRSDTRLMDYLKGTPYADTSVFKKIIGGEDK